MAPSETNAAGIVIADLLLSANTNSIAFVWPLAAGSGRNEIPFSVGIAVCNACSTCPLAELSGPVRSASSTVDKLSPDDVSNSGPGPFAARIESGSKQYLVEDVRLAANSSVRGITDSRKVGFWFGASLRMIQTADVHG